MKSLNLFPVIFLIFVFAHLFQSCEEETSKESVCKVIKNRMTNGGADTSVFLYTYNASGKLIKTDMGGGFYFTYTWETNKMTLKYYCADTVNYTEVYTLNFDGNAVSCSHSVKGTVTSTSTYEYTDDGYLSKKTIDPATVGTPTDYYTYEYSDGNLVTIYREQSEEGNYASTTTNEFYSDKENTLHTSAGIFGKENVNLLKKSTFESTSPVNTTPIVTSYNYQIDPNGNVLKMMQTIGSNTIYSLPLYECNE